MHQNILKISFLLTTLVLAACSRSVIAIKPDYDFNRIQRVALLGFRDFPLMPESGQMAASIFEKSLLRASYQVIERRRIKEILREHEFELSGAVNPETAKRIGNILGVDALIFGNITIFTPEKKDIVYVDIHEVDREPIIVKKPKKVKRGDKWVTIEVEEITGYTVSKKIYQVPQSYTMEAEAGMSVRMVDVETGELLWVGSSNQEAVNIQVALEIVSKRIMKAVKKTWPKTLLESRS